MTPTLTSPAALWLLLALPAVWFAAWASRTNFSPRQRALQAFVRSALLAALVLALARPTVAIGSRRVSIVYVVDVSHSVSGRAIAKAADRIDALSASLTPAHSTIVVFGSKAIVVPDTAAVRAFEHLPEDGDADAVDRAGTDLEQALTQARAELEADSLPRIVLFTDGRPTSGSVQTAVARLGADGIPVFVDPTDVRDIGDAWVDAITPPANVPAGTPVTLTALVTSQRPFPEATIEIAEGSRTLATSDVSLPTGSTPVPLTVTFDTPGPHVVHATLRAAGDPLSENNGVAREVVVAPRVRVLYVENTAASAKYLQRALMQSGFDVTTRAPAGLPSSREALQAWDVVVLSDVPRAAMPNASMHALAQWVEEDGGGLLVAGGDAVFGESKEGAADGYRRTELERLTPVTFERKDEPGVALVVVLDKSSSMAGMQMELCKAAVQAAVDVLPDAATMGLISFNDEYTWDLTPRNIGKNRDLIRRTIAAVEATGTTLIYPALEQAYLAMRKTKAGAKHIVLLSDGRTYADDYEGLTKKMVAAKMTVSTIAVGRLADAELLNNIAKWGQGRSYVVLDAKQVPQIFVKEAKDAATPAFDEGSAITPVVKAATILGDVDLAHVPPLRGRTAMVMKPTATEVLATQKDDPLLAYWPIGLGRTAAFASDVKDRWASAWVGWRGYAPLFAAVIRSLARPPSPDLALDVTAGPASTASQEFSLTVEARDANGGYQNLMTPAVTVQLPGNRRVKLSPHQVGPGRYLATLIANPRDLITATVDGSEGSPWSSRTIVPDLAMEYRFQPPDETLLRSIALGTGGVYRPTADDLRRVSRTADAARREAWPTLVAIALALWFCDVLLRRIRVFEPTV